MIKTDVPSQRNGIAIVSGLSVVIRNFSRVAKYAFAKTLVLFKTVVVGLYLTILVVNLGGYVDKAFYSDVADMVDGVIKSCALCLPLQLVVFLSIGT